MTRISPAHTLCRRHKPCSRPPCVLTDDFESELKFTHFRRLCLLFPFFLFFLEKRPWKVTTQTFCPFSCRRVFVLSCFCVPSHRDRYNQLVSCLSASGLFVWNCSDFSNWDTWGQSSRSMVDRREKIKNREERQEEMRRQRDCRFKVSTSHSCCIVRVRRISWTEVS